MSFFRFIDFFLTPAHMRKDGILHNGGKFPPRCRQVVLQSRHEYSIVNSEPDWFEHVKWDPWVWM